MKKVKIITIILAIILVVLVAFAGVYIKTQNRMENKVKDYYLGRELEGARVLEVKVSDGKTDEEGNTTKQDESLLTEENYEIVKKTIENRLKNLKAQDYVISLNKEDGTIRVELSEDENTDSYAYYLTASGKVQIKEKDSETELLNDSMIKKAQYTSITNAEGAVQIYVELELTKDGQTKIEEIANNYAILDTEIDEIESAENQNNETTENTENAENTENTDNTENTETTENQEQTSTKKIANLTIGGTEYDIDKIEKNKIRVKIGNQTSNSTSANNNMSKAAEIVMLINAGKYPVDYEIASNRYIASDITQNQILYFVLVVLALIFIILIIFCIKYRISGLLASISCIGFIALYSLLLRYTNALITIEAIGAIILIIALNLKLNKEILNKTKTKNLVNEAITSTYKEMFLKLVPIMIISIVFCFARWLNLSSFGIAMFWGLILIAVYNITVTKALLKLRESK